MTLSRHSRSYLTAGTCLAALLVTSFASAQTETPATAAPATAAAATPAAAVATAPTTAAPAAATIPAPAAAAPTATAPAPATPAAPAPVAVEPAPAPTIAPTMPAATEAPPATEAPVAEPPVAVEEPAATEEAPAEFTPAFNIGIGMRAGIDYRSKNDTSPRSLGVSGNVRPYMYGQAHKYVKWTANLDASTAIANKTAEQPDDADEVGVLDAIIQLEFNDYANFWIGRLLPPTDRANLSGPYFQNAWNYPADTNLYPTLPGEGRDNGLTYWGQAGGGAFKWQLGLFGLGADKELGEDSPMGYLRLTANLLEPEPGYYNSSTYYGKDILAIGLVANSQPNYNGEDTGIRGNVDVLFEKDLGADGVLDLEGAYYHFKEVDDGTSVMVLASYLYNSFQPMVRLQQAMELSAGPDATRDSTTVDVALNYIVDGHNARFTANFQRLTGEATSSNGDVTDIKSNTFSLGGQIQYW